MGSAHLLDGRVPHVVLLELFSDEGIGTMITADPTGRDRQVTERSPLMTTYPPPPVTFVRGEGSWLCDDAGKRYLDFLSGLAVTSLGHAHPVVAEAIAEQARTLLHVSNLFGTEPGPEVARTPRPAGRRRHAAGGQVFFCNSGAEANECAIKLARRFGGRGRHVVVSAFGSFHGRTLATLHATGQPAKHEAFQPLPEGFRHVLWQRPRRPRRGRSTPPWPPCCSSRCRARAASTRPRPSTCGPCASCATSGACCSWSTRCRPAWAAPAAGSASSTPGVRPDVVTMAKALGNGVPIGACWARAEVAAVFEPGDHATTYGGQPLAAAAARAVLGVMEAEDVPARAARAGARLTEALAGVPGVAEVRGLGLLLAVELDGRDARAVNAALLDAGLVANAVTPTALRLAPSLLVSDDEIDHARRPPRAGAGA